MADPDLAALQRQSRWLRALLTALMALLGALILLSWFAPVVTFGREGRPPRSELPEQLLAGLVMWGPAVLYYWALWAVRRALGQIAAGRLFRPAVAASLRDVGLGLAGGAVASSLLQPNAMRLFNDAYGRDLPFAAYGHFDPAYLAVGCIGLALVLLSRVMQRAAEMQAELDQFV
jgi:Protein of unknown function (DUF2975)